MKDRYQTFFEKINIDDIQKFSQELNLDIIIQGTSSNKSKITLINELVDYLFSEKKQNLLYDFCSKGTMLFYPLKILNKQITVFKQIEDKYKVVKKDKLGTFYYPLKPEGLFSNISLFFPKDNNIVILFKKYVRGTKLSVLKNKKAIENNFDIKTGDCIKKDFYFNIFNKIKVNLHYEIAKNKAFVIINYVSHQFQTPSINISSKLNYSRPAKKEVLANKVSTSENINRKFQEYGIPEEVEYSVNIPHSSQENIKSCGVNLYLKLNGSNKTTRYALNFKKLEIRFANTDADIQDLVNIVKILPDFETK